MYEPCVPPVLLNALAAQPRCVDVVCREGIGHEAHPAHPPRCAESIRQWLAARGGDLPKEGRTWRQ